VLTATQMMAAGAGHVLQPRLRPHAEIEAKYGPRLWPVWLLLFMRSDGPHIHRTVAKIATGGNPVDNYWRVGNTLGAIRLSAGRFARVVRGTGSQITCDEVHPDTGLPVIGFNVPDWSGLCGRAREAAAVFPGIRT
jgi:hypothetical protein